MDFLSISPFGLVVFPATGPKGGVLVIILGFRASTSSFDGFGFGGGSSRFGGEGFSILEIEYCRQPSCFKIFNSLGAAVQIEDSENWVFVDVRF